MLREADWDPHGADVCEYPVTGMPNETGEGYVDYVLWGRDRLAAGAGRGEADEGQSQPTASSRPSCTPTAWSG